MRLSGRALSTGLFALGLAVSVVLAIAGGVRHFSPVPYMDMWNGQLHFFLLASDGGGWPLWWQQHNEHRIVLARSLFWMDLAWFGGSGVFLVAMNYLFVALAVAVFALIVRDQLAPAAWQGRSLMLPATLFTGAFLFSWMQYENLIWAFQSQFFLAQLLPMVAFYWLYRADVAERHRTAWFAAACAMGVASIGTMASGVLALPLMAAYAAVRRMGAYRVAVLALLAALCIGAYFAGYGSPQGHGTLRSILVHDPGKLAAYVSLYIGGPLYHLSGPPRSVPLGQAAGALFVLLATWKLWTCLRRPQGQALTLALLAFVAYIGGTAVGTGAGRLVFGVEQATASRYTTPALMAWAALLAMYLPTLARMHARWHAMVLVPALALLLSMVVLQVEAVESHRLAVFERNVAALAIELGIADDAQLRSVYVNSRFSVPVGREAAQRDLSVWNQAWVKDAGAAFGLPASLPSAGTCAMSVDEIADVPGDGRYRKISGRVILPGQATALPALQLVSQGVAAGHVLIEAPVFVRAGRPKERRFKGYVLRDGSQGLFHAVPLDRSCVARIELPAAPPFRIDPATEASAAETAHQHAVVHNAGWTGTDYERSHMAGLKVLGSRVLSDADTGTVSLQLRHGDTVLYRSGPTPQRQSFRIDDGQRFAGTMPLAKQWITLRFDHPGLPPRFNLTLSDQGDGWGEWSAIAVRDTASEK